MPRVCHFTGRKTSMGRQKTTRGKAKYLGGVGTKTTGITARKFRPNIQKVRALIDGQIVRPPQHEVTHERAVHRHRRGERVEQRG